MLLPRTFRLASTLSADAPLSDCTGVVGESEFATAMAADANRLFVPGVEPDSLDALGARSARLSSIDSADPLLEIVSIASSIWK